MNKRTINGISLNPIGLGCMNLSHAYGKPPTEEDASRLLLEAVDLGVEHFDTAALYGFGKNEVLVGKALKPVRDKIFLASKCGMTGVDGKRVIDGRPKALRATIEQSLTNLQTDVLDLYYLHRWDRKVPIEESVGELSRMVEEGKIKSIGLSEVSAKTLQRAHTEHKIAALQTEYSLWTRNAEIAVLDACKALGTSFVAFSPLARGFLTEQVTDPSILVDGDIRKGMPRFQHPHFEKNKALLNVVREISNQANCSLAQVNLAWLLHQGDNIHPIPGTTQTTHLRDNLGAIDVNLTHEQLSTLDNAFVPEAINGKRYPLVTQQEIDTEEF
ncbi:aldo/keto reductase [Colwellia sp. 6M3]|jgi:aryl-alcohol dehydrogenase-like predicted oxidoreductase|uniref:aldo/keto reductase n=1 Tax=Colwellia sp. 6M3 TaxID=2759849 RepID=UPI0015F377FF|nr:aldo/keto reductase [Colwellia sp. 6M3]MBA6416971.1 aldo/keto reductase [Colwellia sp. 6M3]